MLPKGVQMATSADLLILSQNSRFSAFINPSSPKLLLAASAVALQLWLQSPHTLLIGGDVK